MKTASPKLLLKAAGIIPAWMLVFLLASHTAPYFSKTLKSKPAAVKTQAEMPPNPHGNSDLAKALWQEAERLRAEQRLESNLKAIEKYKAAADHWRSSG